MIHGAHSSAHGAHGTRSAWGRNGERALRRAPGCKCNCHAHLTWQQHPWSTVHMSWLELAGCEQTIHTAEGSPLDYIGSSFGDEAADRPALPVIPSLVHFTRPVCANMAGARCARPAGLHAAGTSCAVLHQARGQRHRHKSCACSHCG